MKTDKDHKIRVRVRPRVKDRVERTSDLGLGLQGRGCRYGVRITVRLKVRTRIRVRFQIGVEAKFLCREGSG